MTEEIAQIIKEVNCEYDSVSVKTMSPVLEEYINYYNHYTHQDPPSWRFLLVLNEFRPELRTQVISTMRQIMVMAEVEDSALDTNRIDNDLRGIAITLGYVKILAEQLPALQEKLKSLKGDELRKTQLAVFLCNFFPMHEMEWAMAVQMGTKGTDDDPVHPWQRVVEMPRYQKTRPGSAVSMCRALIVGESMRQIYLTDKKVVATAQNFNREIRNGCFDIYINGKYKDIKREMEADNCRLYAPTDKEVYEQMYKVEEAELNRLKGLRGLCGSQAYEEQYGEGGDHIVELADLFMRYLADKIKHAAQPTVEEALPAPASANLPRERKYTDLVRWIAQQKKEGKDWYKEADYNRTRMCEKLSEVLGWLVDQNSLRKAENRVQK